MLHTLLGVRCTACLPNPNCMFCTSTVSCCLSCTFKLDAFHICTECCAHSHGTLLECTAISHYGATSAVDVLQWCNAECRALSLQASIQQLEAENKSAADALQSLESQVGTE